MQDAAGNPLDALVEIASASTGIQRMFQACPQGECTAKALHFGIYELNVRHAGFAGHRELVEVRSEVPVMRSITLGVAPLETTLTIRDFDTLLDPHRTDMAYHVGADALKIRRSSQPGRAVLELVQRQPGWLLEANGVLHPRGSEYDTQYIVDGIPILDNRSPNFAPALEAEEIQSMRILTASYPAEYGRKLGGVIEVSTIQDFHPGFRGKAVLQGGSFGTRTGYLAGQYAKGRTTAGLSVEAMETRRYLDPPVEENFTNNASGGGITGRVDHDFNRQDRLRLYVHRKSTGFLVPNELPQQEAGQRQDRRNDETMAHASYQHIFSPNVLGGVRAMVRDLSGELWSNPLSTPIYASQERGFREGYFGGSVAANLGAHELKSGTEMILTSAREQFAYRITRPGFFDDEIAPDFRFSDRRRGREHSVYVQDLVRTGRWTFRAGVRWDRYSFLVNDNAVSPRLGVAWHWPAAGMVFRASYDRAFQIPAIENLLLASSPAVQRVSGESLRLPVPPSRGNFYQAGFSKSAFGRLRLDAAYFRRNLRNFSDDDVFLNTGISFPISFARAEIHGFEGKLEIPNWGPFSGFVSYSNLAGVGYLPLTGGLFLEDEALDQLDSTDRFPITQDQRNTVQARFRYQAASRVWFALGGWYGSGLPIETEEELDPAELAERFSHRILRRANLARGRVRQSIAVDSSVGIDVWSRERRAVRLQVDAMNITNRLNVINFAGLFSGTALAPPRTLAMRLQAEF